MSTDLDRDDSPILSPSNCTCAALRAAGRAVVQFYDGALSEVGLTVNQFALLSTLGDAGPVTMTKLAAMMVTDRTTLTRTLRPLERDGLIETVRGADRRRRSGRPAIPSCDSQGRLGSPSLRCVHAARRCRRCRCFPACSS